MIFITKIIIGLIFSYDFDLKQTNNFSYTQISNEVPQAKISFERKLTKKELTIMIFMNGKNDLANYVLKDLNELEVYGSNENVNIVVEAGRINYNPPSYNYPGYPDYYPDIYPHPGFPGIHPHWPPLPPYLSKNQNTQTGLLTFIGVKRFFVTKDTDTSKINSQIVEELSKADMGDWNHLVDFVTWAKKNYPAKKYMLIVWNHGDGWKNKKIFGDIIRGISYDSETKNEISTIQLGQALSQMGSIDIYASDACLMQMIEVVYELKDYTPIIIGSQETEPGDGWYYDAFLKKLYSKSLTPQNIASSAVDAYMEEYSKISKAVTQSALKTHYIDNLRYELDLFVNMVIQKGEKDKIKNAVKKTISFGGSGSKDLLELLKNISEELNDQNIMSKYNDIKSILNSKIIIKKGGNLKYSNVSGLSIYMPDYDYDTKYDNLKFSKVGYWDDFVKWIYSK